MPNRILRDCCDSEKINGVSVHAERLFYRLVQKGDDYGRLFASPKLLRPLLFPLQLDTVRETDLSRWLTELATVRDGHKPAGLIRLYEVEGREYLEIREFRQQRRSESKYPPPPPEDELRSSCAADDAQPRSYAKAHAQSKAQATAPPPDTPQTAKKVPIPPHLCTPGFLGAWKKWEVHLGQKRVRTTALADEQQLAKCEAWGPIESTRNILHSISGNYQGIYPPRGDGGKNGTATASAKHVVVRGET